MDLSDLQSDTCFRFIDSLDMPKGFQNDLPNMILSSIQFERILKPNMTDLLLSCGKCALRTSVSGEIRFVMTSPPKNIERASFFL